MRVFYKDDFPPFIFHLKKELLVPIAKWDFTRQFKTALNQAIPVSFKNAELVQKYAAPGQEAANLNGKIRAMETSFVWKIPALTVFGKRTQSHGKIFILRVDHPLQQFPIVQRLNPLFPAILDSADPPGLIMFRGLQRQFATNRGGRHGARPIFAVDALEIRDIRF